MPAHARARRRKAYCLYRLNHWSDWDVSGVIGKELGSRSFVVIKLICVWARMRTYGRIEVVRISCTGWTTGPIGTKQISLERSWGALADVCTRVHVRTECVRTLSTDWTTGPILVEYAVDLMSCVQDTEILMLQSCCPVYRTNCISATIGQAKNFLREKMFSKTTATKCITKKPGCPAQRTSGLKRLKTKQTNWRKKQMSDHFLYQQPFFCNSIQRQYYLSACF